MTRKVGILGGTFNPIHIGHVLIAQDALEQVGLDCVKFIPSATPPHKQANKLASAADRIAMIKLAIRSDRRFEVDDLEIKRGGKSYSVDTLTELRKREPRTRFYFIIGSDSLRELHTWREIGRLAKLCTFVTLARPGFQAKHAAKLKLDAVTIRKIQRHIVRGHVCDVSSSEIRERIARGRSIRYLVPDAVDDYIRRRKLYR